MDGSGPRDKGGKGIAKEEIRDRRVEKKRGREEGKSEDDASIR